eukprot:TRINITY_DN26108_c0_g3_i1.p1 TRINITY_DN26108_c0_g3~~TRINITY_DN26108_c0_g3_i1.p1  ORF type:complete len:598 (-),score=89.11 TRINITY_DN26108_c0_g3_i1:200-1993(-)
MTAADVDTDDQWDPRRFSFTSENAAAPAPSLEQPPVLLCSSPRSRSKPRPPKTEFKSQKSFLSVTSDVSLMQEVQRRMSEARSARGDVDEPDDVTYLSGKPSSRALKMVTPRMLSLTTVLGLFAFGLVSLCCLAFLILIHRFLASVPNELLTVIESREFRESMSTAYNGAIIISVVAIALGVSVGCCLGGGLSRSLKSTVKVASSADRLDDNDELEVVLKRSCVREVAELKDTLLQNIRSVRTFSRYLPDTVVQQIMQGNKRAQRLHVSRRNVSIMFSDIRSFTTIAEALKPTDLLYLLTRYLSTMTEIVDSFGGVVAEILGDGLLVFWNAVDDVREHAARACATAVIQQLALPALNAELAEWQLPSIAIRIGLHSGKVLSGNIGSETKMKFGCMGDAVNLASRLEGLCKMYDVGVLCSEAVRTAHPVSEMFTFRELDLVQVKGKNNAVRIYEVIGFAEDVYDAPGGDFQSMRNSMSPTKRRSSYQTTLAEALKARACTGAIQLNSNSPSPAYSPHDSDRSFHMSADQSQLIEDYESALHAFQEGRLEEALKLAEALLVEQPYDKATQLLCENVTRCINVPPEEREAWTGVNTMMEK